MLLNTAGHEPLTREIPKPSRSSCSSCSNKKLFQVHAQPGRAAPPQPGHCSGVGYFVKRLFRVCLVPEVSPGCGWPWLRGVAVVSQGCAGLPKVVLRDVWLSQLGTALPSWYHLLWGAACFPSSSNQQAVPGWDTEAELRAWLEPAGLVRWLCWRCCLVKVHGWCPRGDPRAAGTRWVGAPSQPDPPISPGIAQSFHLLSFPAGGCVSLCVWTQHRFSCTSPPPFPSALS